MKATVKKYDEKLKNHYAQCCESQISIGAAFTDTRTGEVATVTAVAKHCLTGKKIIVVYQSAEDIAVPLSIFEMTYQKILEDGEVPF